MGLQWGRARVSAETFLTQQRFVPGHGVLQWGRARVSAETTMMREMPEEDRISFNGAALV
jgi:hypothetical protein